MNVHSASSVDWARLPPLESGGLRSGCLCCGPQSIELSLSSVLCVGCGQVEVTLDGQVVWAGDDERVSLADLESIAARYADHDWRVFFDGPLSDGLYQRQGEGRWVLVRRGRGHLDDDREY